MNVVSTSPFLSGARTPVCCRWIEQGGGLPRQYVCSTYFCGGGGTSPIQSKGLLGGLTPQEMSALSHANLLAIMQQDISEANYQRQQATNPNISPEAQAQALQNALEFEAEAAAIQAWLNLTPHQQASYNPVNFFSQVINNYLASYNNSVNYLNTGVPPTAPVINPSALPGQNSSFTDTLSQQVAGLPIWGWGLLLTGGLIFMNK